MVEDSRSTSKSEELYTCEKLPVVSLFVSYVQTSSITPSKETQLAPIPADKPLDLPALETGEEMKDQGGDQQEVAQVKEVLEVIRRYSASFEEGGIDLSGLQVEEEDGEQKENPIREM